MAPTICSEKKPRQIRANLKEIRRQPNNAANALLSTLATTGSAATNGSGTSSIINYVAGGRISSTLRVRGPSDDSAADISYTEPLRGERLHMEDEEDEHELSENFVSSSTMGPELVRAIIDEHMELDNDTLDEEDCEVHSITSGARYHNDIAATNSNSNNNKHSSQARQMLHCTVKTVFPAPTLSDKQMLATHTTNLSANKCNNNSHKRLYGSDEEDTDSDTYSSMCEIKKTEGLLSIALKTIKLVKRNQLLQRRLAQLQVETSEFIQSVMANPENRHIRGNMNSPATTISSTPSSPSMPSPSTESPLTPLQSPTTTTTTMQHSQNAAEA
ncbi:uncharacterized protein LOC105222495 [Bactrocera dorsalis]|uniref:Uncharacterized protein LOC105222495 n=1 Tax=Bactrocera dorsalis TaxID=27457 RepID=A0A6I9URD5_BACDO|nr:uncharacterized protein LOC105222495 [Bactrocera dorsalis]XP_049306459.1 uncharacterized protein LOC105222495 [Bactrocera dorsalis]XP_049306460.1 uncharacterized protein LOC105222495 [Bactrocera dorsalis]